MAKKSLIILFLLIFCVPSIAAEKKGATEVNGHWLGLNWPLQGEGVRSSQFGSRKHPILGVVRAHGGVDIAAPKGTPVVASLGGRVSKAGNAGELGLHVVVEHAKGLQTTYGHMSEIGVKEGQFVNPRQIIGKVGSTGLSTGPHLHFAVRRDGKTLDPEKWIVPTGYFKK